MKSKLSQEILISATLIILAILLLNPFSLWMPGTLFMFVVLFLVLAFIFYSLFIWREKAEDERELMHKMFAGRWSYLSGAAVLVLAIALQSFNHDLDSWLVIALVVMVLAKVISLVYSRNNH